MQKELLGLLVILVFTAAGSSRAAADSDTKTEIDAMKKDIEDHPAIVTTALYEAENDVPELKAKK